MQESFKTRLIASIKNERRLLEAFILLLVSFIPSYLFDSTIFMALNSVHSPISDLAWISLTTLGDGLLLAIILGSFLLINPQVTFVGLLIMLLSSLAVHGIKLFQEVPRPVEVIESLHIVGPILRWGSFPSGHTAAGISAGLSLAYFSSSKLMSVVVVSIAVLISLSRIFVGAHFPTDVLGGMIIAVGLFSLFSMVLWPTLRDRIPEQPNFSNIFFRLALWSELLAAVFAFFIYAPFVAEYPPVAAVVAVAVLTFLGYRYRKVRLLPS